MLNPPPRAGAISALDDLLRGRLTDAKQLRDGATPVRRFLPWAIVLGAIHGCFIGWYALCAGMPGAALHMLAVMLKLPALFLLTLFVTFPSLYVFNALVGVGLHFRAMLRLLIATIVVNLALAASLGPILAFFTLSTTSYGFIVLLNVALLGVAGLVSIGFLLRALVRLQALEEEEIAVQNKSSIHTNSHVSAAKEPEIAPPIPSESAAASSPAPNSTLPGTAWRSRVDPPATNPFAGWKLDLDPPRRSAMGIIWIWIITYAIVGSQMGWILRPFIGHPNQPLTFFRPRSGSFVESVLNTTSGLLSSDRAPGRNTR